MSKPPKPQALVLPPTGSKHSGTVIFLHGLGDTGYGWEDAMLMVQKSLPTVKFVLPHAPNRPVTLNGGMIMPAWYDIVDLSSRSRTDLDGLKETQALIEKLISEEEAGGLKADRIIVGGFSQGGAAGLFSAYQSAKKLAGILALSTYLPGAELFSSVRKAASYNSETKLLMCHGTEDEVVAPQWGKKSFEVLKSLGVDGTLKIYPGMPHSASYEEIKDLTEFIGNQIGAKASL